MPRRKCACRAYPDTHHCFQWAKPYGNYCNFCLADHPSKITGEGAQTAMGRRMGEFEFAAAQDEAEDQMLKIEETSYSSAGVTRCCVQSLGDFFDSRPASDQAKIGTKVKCTYSKDPEAADHGMTLVDRNGKGIWMASWIAEK